MNNLLFHCMPGTAKPRDYKECGCKNDICIMGWVGNKFVQACSKWVLPSLGFLFGKLSGQITWIISKNSTIWLYFCVLTILCSDCIMLSSWFWNSSEIFAAWEFFSQPICFSSACNLCLSEFSCRRDIETCYLADKEYRWEFDNVFLL